MIRDHLTIAAGAPSEPVLTEIGDAPLALGDLLALARGHAHARVTEGALARMQASAELIARKMAEEGALYGITTGVGASVVTAVPPERSAELSLNLLRMHGCGTGRTLGEEAAAAVLATRLTSLSRGASGVRPVVAERIAALLNERVVPVIPEEGSVGASGDLTPLSYVAAVLVGEREVLQDGRVVPAARALEALGLEPLVFGPKEALALMNGTSVATALGILAWERARRLARLASAITAVVSETIGGNPAHFDAFIHA
ncbi:MAG: aromatic amino acid lyase, partial [Myxococcales bacterium]|nr:aromatic amino acid lyase [Myxococcales bacterium]